MKLTIPEINIGIVKLDGNKLPLIKFYKKYHYGLEVSIGSLIGYVNISQ